MSTTRRRRRRLRPGEHVVTCRACGARGIEDETDPCPGLCPPCLDAALSGTHDQLLAWDRDHPAAPPVASARFLAGLLRRVGLTEAAIRSAEWAGRWLPPGRLGEGA
jgi:hypothetical protein